MIAQTSESHSAVDSDVDLDVEAENRVTEEQRGDTSVLVAEDEESIPPRPLFGSWGASLWSGLTEAAADFTASLAAENEETIEAVKENLQQDKLEENVGKVGDFIAGSLSQAVNTAMDVVSDTASVTSAMAASLTESQTGDQSSHSHIYGGDADDSLEDWPSVDPKYVPFEKERATYAMDPLRSSKHNSKFREFIESELSRHSDSDLSRRGRELMRGNRAITTYFHALVPADLEESVFWQRYFYWRHRYEQRERMLSMMSPGKVARSSSQSSPSSSSIPKPSTMGSTASASGSTAESSGCVTDPESDLSSSHNSGGLDHSATPPALSDTLVSHTVDLDRDAKAQASLDDRDASASAASVSVAAGSGSSIDQDSSRVGTEDDTGVTSAGIESSSMEEVKSSSEPESWNDITLSQIESSGAESMVAKSGDSASSKDPSVGIKVAEEEVDDDNWGDWE